MNKPKKNSLKYRNYWLPDLEGAQGQVRQVKGFNSLQLPSEFRINYI